MNWIVWNWSPAEDEPSFSLICVNCTPVFYMMTMQNWIFFFFSCLYLTLTHFQGHKFNKNQSFTRHLYICVWPLYLDIQWKHVKQNPKLKAVKTKFIMWFLPWLTFITLASRCPFLSLSLTLDPPLATLWCSFRSNRHRAGAGQAMLVLTEFPAVVVSTKLDFYVNWTGVGQTHACVGKKRNVT